MQHGLSDSEVRAKCLLRCRLHKCIPEECDSIRILLICLALRCDALRGAVVAFLWNAWLGWTVSRHFASAAPTLHTCLRIYNPSGIAAFSVPPACHLARKIGLRALLWRARRPIGCLVKKSCVCAAALIQFLVFTVARLPSV